MSGYQTILQLSALAGFWGAYASHSTFPESSALQWQLPTAIQLIPGILLLVGTLFIPETPGFLAEKGRFEDAEKSLVRLRGVKSEEWMVAGEMEEIRDAARVSALLKERKESFFKELLKRGIRKRLVVGVGLMIAQNMVGLNALNYCKFLRRSRAGRRGADFKLRCTCDLHVRRLHICLILSILDWSIWRRQASLSHRIHVRLRQNQG
jgi:hypothetical protein